MSREKNEYLVGYGRPPKGRPFLPGQSGNPGGMRRGTPLVSSALRRLMSMNALELSEFQPQCLADVMAMRLLYSGMYGLDPLPAIKEISDRTEGKAIQRRLDVGAEEIVSKAKVLYAVGQRFVAQMQAAVCCEGCGQRLDLDVSSESLLLDILGTIDEQYHDVVIRELEAMGE